MQWPPFKRQAQSFTTPKIAQHDMVNSTSVLGLNHASTASDPSRDQASRRDGKVSRVNYQVPACMLSFLSRALRRSRPIQASAPQSGRYRRSHYRQRQW